MLALRYEAFVTRFCDACPQTAPGRATQRTDHTVRGMTMLVTCARERTISRMSLPLDCLMGARGDRERQREPGTDRGLSPCSIRAKSVERFVQRDEFLRQLVARVEVDHRARHLVRLLDLHAGAQVGLAHRQALGY